MSFIIFSPNFPPFLSYQFKQSDLKQRFINILSQYYVGQKYEQDPQAYLTSINLGLYSNNVNDWCAEAFLCLCRSLPYTPHGLSMWLL